MKYGDIIDRYKSTRFDKCAQPTERILAIRDLFKQLKSEGLTKEELTEDLLDYVGEAATSPDLEEGRYNEFKRNASKFFSMMLENLEQGEPVQAEPEVKEEQVTAESAVNELKPEDFAKKEYSQEVMDLIGVTVDPEKGVPHE